LVLLTRFWCEEGIALSGFTVTRYIKGSEERILFMANIALSSWSNWSEVWTTAISGPSVQNYKAIISEPEANTRRAYIWVLGTITVIITIYLILAVVHVPVHITPFRGLARGGGSFPVSLSCGLPIALVVGAIAFTAEVALVKFFAGLAGADRTDKDERLTYLLAAIQSPMAFFYLLFLLLPEHILLTALCGVVLGYNLYLVTQALRAVYNFKWQRALIVVLLTVMVNTSILFLFTLIVPR
jgi:hypothetical protein